MAASLPAPLLKTSPKIGFAPSAAQAKMRLKWWKTDSPPDAKRKIPFRRKKRKGIFLRVCQNAHFGFTLEGASEWLRCKAMRMRAQGVY